MRSDDCDGLVESVSGESEGARQLRELIEFQNEINREYYRPYRPDSLGTVVKKCYLWLVSGL